MAIRSLAEVRTRLEEAVMALPGERVDSADLYDRYEEMAIQTLDSAHSEFAEGLLQEYLETYLNLKRLELALPALESQEQ